METGYDFRLANESDEDAIAQICKGKQGSFAALRGLFKTSCTSSLWHVFVVECQKTKEIVGCAALLVADSGTTIVDMFFEVTRDRCDQKVVRAFSKYCLSYVIQRHRGVRRRRGNYSVDKLLGGCHKFPKFRVIAENTALKYRCKPVIVNYLYTADLRSKEVQRLCFDDFIHCFRSSEDLRDLVQEGILQIGDESFNVDQLSSPEYNYLNNQCLIFINSGQCPQEQPKPDYYRHNASHQALNTTGTHRGSSVLTILSLRKLHSCTDGVSFRITIYGNHPDLTISHLDFCLSLVCKGLRGPDPITLVITVNSKSADVIGEYFEKLETSCDASDKPLTICTQKIPCWLIDFEGDSARGSIFM